MEKKGLLVGVHFNKFFGRPGRVEFFDGEVRVSPRKMSPRAYRGPLKISRKRTEPPFANHWIELRALDGHPVWLTCSKKRALELARLAEAHGIGVEWD